MTIDRQQVYNQHVAGLITEASFLTFPENASTDELNCLLFRDGRRRRRLGCDFEDNYSLSSQNPTLATIRDKALMEGRWTSVGGDGNLNFLVLQVDTTLYFYNLGSDPLSGGQKTFTVNLSTYAASGATDIGSEPVNMDSGKGLLFVVSEKIEPIRIEYDSSGDTITVTQTTLQIRDFDGLAESPALDNDEEPASLSTTHDYNLKNQGWASPGSGIADPVSTYFTSKSVYPPNSKQWWTGKDSTDTFDADLLAKYSAGNTKAPRGHFLLNPFYKDRSDASGVVGITVESVTTRPHVVSFFAGRVWYMGLGGTNINGHIFFSQTLTEAGKAGNCYQESDPTTEELNELVDTDGGVIVIPEIGDVHGAVATEENLFIFATNGVWSISGASETGFKATDFWVQKLGSSETSVGVVGQNSIVKTEGFPFWFSETGVYTIGIDQVTGKPFPQPVSDSTILTFFQDIPALSRAYAKGVFDPATKRIYWFYHETAPVNDEYRWRYNKCLIYETRFGSFYPWKIESLSVDSPWIFGIVNTATIAAIERTEQLADSNSDTLIDGSSNRVVVDVQTIGGSSTFLKWLCMVPDGASGFNWTFAEFANGDFVDWESKDTVGVDYSSYFTTGYDLAGSLFEKGTPLVLVFMEKTETGVAGGNLVTPSSLFMQTRFDWTDSGDAGKWSEKQQVYSLKREFDTGLRNDIKTGHQVIISTPDMKGLGRAVQFHFESEAGHDFILLGWQVLWDDKPGT